MKNLIKTDRYKILTVMFFDKTTPWLTNFSPQVWRIIKVLNTNLQKENIAPHPPVLFQYQ